MRLLLLAVLAAPTALPARASPPPRHPVFDAGCDRPLDLRAAGGAMEHVAVRDQDRENECYAEAASALVDAWRFTKDRQTNYGHQTSGIALALEANADLLGTGIARPDIDILGPAFGAGHALGEPCMAVEAAVDHGSCDQRAVLTSLDGASLTDTIAALRRYYQDYQAWRAEHDTTQESVRVIASGEDSKRTRVARALEARLSNLRAGLRVPAAALGPLLDAPEPVVFLEGVMTYACSRGHLARLRREPDCAREVFVSPEEAHPRMLHRLRSSREPIAVGFCGGLLGAGRAFEARFHGLPGPARLAAPLTCGNHVAAVIGYRRHPESGKCQYLVRNSLGPSCGGVSPDWQCDAGDVWVDAESFAPSVGAMAFLQ